MVDCLWEVVQLALLQVSPAVWYSFDTATFGAPPTAGAVSNQSGSAVQGICLESFPEVIALQNSDEDVFQLSSLQPALLLERWLSHHLAYSAAAVTAGAEDAEEAARHSSPQLIQQYAALLHALEPACCAPAAMRCRRAT